MGESTAIAWTDHTFNAWWGCQRVSPGCEHCYAETFDARVFPDEARTRLRRETNGNKLAVATHWGPVADRRTFGEKHWREPLKWNAAAAKAGKRARVFCSSMADVFEDRRDLDAERAKLWPLIAETPWLDWQLLTKRPENMRALAPDAWREEWPSNVWAGCTAESAAMLDARLPILVRVPAAVRFLSCEPLLDGLHAGPDSDPIGLMGTAPKDWGKGYTIVGSLIHWVIVGGESGRGARPFHIEWARRIVADCRGANVACFMKQMGSRAIGADGGRVPFTGKGDNPNEWAEDLRVQEFPS